MWLISAGSSWSPSGVLRLRLFDTWTRQDRETPGEDSLLSNIWLNDLRPSLTDVAYTLILNCWLGVCADAVTTFASLKLLACLSTIRNILVFGKGALCHCAIKGKKAISCLLTWVIFQIFYEILP